MYPTQLLRLFGDYIRASKVGLPCKLLHGGFLSTQSKVPANLGRVNLEPVGEDICPSYCEDITSLLV